MRRIRAGEQGGAAVEFALLTLVLVPTMLYAIYFYELSLAKLKAQEAGRYLVWEMTAVRLSDYQADGDRPAAHQALFDQQKSALLSEVQNRWGDDLDGATPNILAFSNLAKPLTIEVTFPQDKLTLTNNDAEIYNVALTSGFNTGPINKVMTQVFDHFGFNNKGKIEGSVTFHVKNIMLGKMMLPGFQQDMLPSQEMDFPIAQAIIADQWDLKKGDDAVETMQGNRCSSDYCKQVHHMAFLGFAAKLGFINNLGNYLGFFGVHWPLNSTVASKPLTGGGAEGSMDLIVNDPPDHATMRKHYTNVYKDTRNKDDSPYYKAYSKRGPNYLGCPCPKKVEGECSYTDSSNCGG